MRNQKEVKSSSAAQVTSSNENCVEWIQTIHPDIIKGVALVIHGLNLKPDKMNSVISLLTHSNIGVLNVSLSGHGKNFGPKKHIVERKARMETFKTVSYELWIKETYQAYGIAEKMSRKKHAPLFLVGYSLGALMGADLFASYAGVCFNRMVLLAPALCIRRMYYCLKCFFPFPKLVIPSFLSTSYRSNFGTPVAAYHVLFEAIGHFRQNVTPKLNVPTILIIDPRDEFVPAERLKHIINSKRFDQWKLHLLKKGEKHAKKKPHHLIIDESTAGIDSWNEIKHLIIQHLLC